MKRTKSCTAVGLTAAAACGAPGDGPPFVSDVSYDTVAAVGAADETNPLLVYRVPYGLQLIGETTVLYADNTGGTLTAVDLTTGEGWQIRDERGSGPGEFGGAPPWFSENDGRIYTAVTSGQASVRSLDGALIEGRQYREFILDDLEAYGFVTEFGMLAGGTLIAYLIEHAGPEAGVTQRLTQLLRAYSVKDGRLWSYELPTRVVQMEEGPGGSRASTTLSGDPVIAHARDSTVAVGMGRQREIVLLNADGTERARTELPYDPFLLFVDADERVWVQVWEPDAPRTAGWIVLDRNLNPVMRAKLGRVRDARGDYVLTSWTDEHDVVHLFLLKKRQDH